MASRNVETLLAAHQAYNRRDFDAIVSLMAEDVTYEDRAREVTFSGRAGFRDFVQGWATAFPDSQVCDAVYIDAGDTVVAQFDGRGANDGPLGPLPPTGNTINTHFCEIFRFNAEGQIASACVYYDQLSMMVRLGHIQPPERATAA